MTKILFIPIRPNRSNNYIDNSFSENSLSFRHEIQEPSKKIALKLYALYAKTICDNSKLYNKIKLIISIMKQNNNKKGEKICA